MAGTRSGRSIGRPTSRGRAIRGTTSSRPISTAENAPREPKNRSARAGSLGRGGRGRRGDSSVPGTDSHLSQHKVKAPFGYNVDNTKKSAGPFRGGVFVFHAR